MEATGNLRGRYEQAFEEVTAPFAFVDLDAVHRNAETMLAQARGKPIRIASKSVRCRALLERLVGHRPRSGESGPRSGEAGRFRGLLTFTLAEALFLAGHGWRDLVLAYPTGDSAGLAELAELTAAKPDSAPVVMVDSVRHLDLIESATAAARPPIRVAIDLDASLWLLGGRARIGVKRSPVHTAGQAVQLATEISRRPGVELAGLMAYEAQVAGVADRPSGQPLRGAAIRWMQRRSAQELSERRAEVVDAVRRLADIGFVNGGGTGSLSLTSREEAVTELAAGSGFFAPAQFDGYDRIELSPAAGFALPVVRKPSPSVATVSGGGYLASGPGDASRLPVPWLPAGLELDGQEGAGEVQTPLLGAAARGLEIGDRAYFRHVKAGELCERFNSLYLVEGDRIVDEVPTYRGEGRCFL